MWSEVEMYDEMKVTITSDAGYQTERDQGIRENPNDKGG
jgi:hypothetical protein